MTHCYNCGHTGTFVLLVQFALAVPGPDPRAADSAVVDRADSEARSTDRDGSDAPADRRRTQADSERASQSGGLSLSVQCPVCDSTDVGVPAGDLLARYGATTTS